MCAVLSRQLLRRHARRSYSLYVLFEIERFSRFGSLGPLNTPFTLFMLRSLSPTKIARLQVQLRAQTIQRRGAPLRSAPLGSVRLRSAPLGSARAPLTSGVSLGLVCRAAAHAGEPPSVHDGEPPSVHEYTAGSRPGYRWSVRPQQRRVLSIGRGWPDRHLQSSVQGCSHMRVGAAERLGAPPEGPQHPSQPRGGACNPGNHQGRPC